MLDPLISSFEKAFVEFSLGRTLYILFILALAFGGLWVFDDATGYSTYTRLDHQLTALERLHALEQKGADKSPALAPTFKRTVDLLSQVQAAPVAPRVLSERVIKFLAGAALPLLFALAGLSQMLQRQPAGLAMFGGAMLFVVVLGLPSVLIPTLWGSIRATVLVLLAGQVLVMGVLLRLGKRRKPAV